MGAALMHPEKREWYSIHALFADIPWNSLVRYSILGIFSAIWALLFFMEPLWAFIGFALAFVLLVLVLRPFFTYLTAVVLMHAVYVVLIMKNLQAAYVYTVLDLFLVVAAFTWAGTRLFKIVSTPYPKTPCDPYVVLFAVLMLVSLSWSHNYQLGAMQLLRIFPLLVYSFLITLAVVDTDKKIRIVLWLIVSLAVIDSLVSFYSLYLYPHYAVLYSKVTDAGSLKILFNIANVGKRGHSLMPPLTTALVLGFSALVTFGLMLVVKNRFKRVAVFMSGILIITGLMSTLSKGPLLAMMAGFFFMFMAIKPVRRHIFTALITLLAVVVFSFLLSNINTLTKSVGFTQHQLSDKQGSSTKTRSKWWADSVEKIKDTYGLGVGIGGLPRYLRPQVTDPHNAYISVFAELGFAGFFLFMIILWIAFKSYLGAIRASKSEYYKRILLGYLAGLVQLLLALFLQFDYIVYLLWWYLGLGFAISRLAIRAPEGYLDEGLPYYSDKRSIVAI